ncbi:hypothetical protein [Tropicimonas sp. S265A]
MPNQLWLLLSGDKMVTTAAHVLISVAYQVDHQLRDPTSSRTAAR